MRRLLILMGAACLGLTSCIIVSDDGCPEGHVRCDGEFQQQCVGDDWVDIADCVDECGTVFAECGVTDLGDLVCVCE